MLDTILHSLLISKPHFVSNLLETAENIAVNKQMIFHYLFHKMRKVGILNSGVKLSNAKTFARRSKSIDILYHTFPCCCQVFQ